MEKNKKVGICFGAMMKRAPQEVFYGLTGEEKKLALVERNRKIICAHIFLQTHGQTGAGKVAVIVKAAEKR